MLSWLPKNISTFGGDIDSIFYLVYYVVGAWFFITYSAIIIFLFLYRRGRNRRASYVTGSTWPQYAWILIPALIVLVLDVWIDFRGAKVWDIVKANEPPIEIQVQVTAKQFNWDFRYPGPDGKFGTDDDLELENELHVPVNKAVRVTLQSRDVIHSFFIPNVRLKQDILPGRKIPAWFEATTPGEYDIPCAELCGVGHSGMLGKLIVHTSGAYQQWVKEKWPSSSS